MWQPSSSGLSKSERVLCEAPKAKKKNHEMKMFEDVRDDSYYWFRDRCSELRSYLGEENSYASVMMSDSDGIMSDLYNEMKMSVKKEDYGDEFAAVRRPNYYYHRWGLTGKNAEVCIDQFDITLDSPYYGKLEARAKDNEGDEIYDITIYNAHSLCSLETLESVTCSFVWAGEALVYIALDKIRGCLDLCFPSLISLFPSLITQNKWDPRKKGLFGFVF